MSLTMEPPVAPAAVPPANPLAAAAMIPRTMPDADSIGAPKTEERGPSRPLLKPEHAERFARWLLAKNMADDLDPSVQGEISAQAKREYDFDDNSRADWKTQYRQWLDFALQVAKQKTYPWPDASNVIFPLVTTAALQFNARAYPAVVMGRNVVKGTVVGDDRGVPAPAAAAAPPGPGMPPDGQVMPGMGPAQPSGQGAPGGQGQGQPPPQWLVPPGAKQVRADKIGQHMSWQLLDEMPEWEEQTDRLLIVLPIVGTMFRKSYYDPAARRNRSITVSALHVCVNYKAKSFYDAPRVTEEFDAYPWDIESHIRSGLWLDPGDGGYGRNTDADGQDTQAPTTFCEQHRRWDIDGDGYDEPVIVTFARDSGKLARIVPCFDEEGIEATEDGEVQKITPIRYYTKYGFIPNPDEGVYDIGFGNLMFPLNAAINTSINQMFDAGHLQIAGGGFIGGGMSINTGSVRFITGEYKVVNTPGRALRENLVPLEMPGPNAVLMALLQFLVEAAKEVGSIKDVLSGDIPGANVPGILGLAVIQQGLKVFNAIFKRVHRALRHDYQLLFRLNRLYLPKEAGYTVGSEYFDIGQQDYQRGGGVEPVSDPDLVTDTQQMAMGNFLLSFKDDPFFDQREIRLRALEAAAVPLIDKILVSTPPPNAAIAQALAQLDLEKQALDLRKTELDIRAAHQEADLDIRRGKDKAVEIRELSQAILNLANAKKADAEADQNWYAQQLDNLRLQIEILNTSSESEPPGDSPAVAAGGAGGPGGGLAGPGGTAVRPVAPPASQPTGADLLGGLSG